ncbi:MAG: 5'/3'-nucleotidase SurE, partial [Bacteroidota bacterium]|nr:5'/3'-nucleotidase SurE [Bacteroidota bacterium]
MKKRKPLILVSNDDGVHAPGLRFLIDCIKGLGRIVVVAPDRPMSGMGHAITLSVPLRCRKIRYDENYEEYSCNGTPVDCIKLAHSKILSEKPDLCIAGINHGNNASINVIYSGTMAIALECALLRIPAIGFSLTEY